MKNIILTSIILCVTSSCEKPDITPFTCDDPLSVGIKTISVSCSCGYDTGSDNCSCDSYVCQYSSFVFYASKQYKPNTGITWKAITVTIKDATSTIGNLKVIYPNSYPECAESGAFTYELESAESIEWEALILWSNNTYEIRKGVLLPSPEKVCIPVPVL
jgi:hypothetical protein